MKRWLSSLVTVEVMAAATACAGQGPKCKARSSRVMRTPFWHDLRMHAQKHTVDVRCARSLYLVGPYACAVSGSP